MLRIPRGRYAWWLAAALILVVLIPVAIAQQVRRAAPTETPLQQVVRALNEGRYDDVEGAAAPLDAGDPVVVELKARALLARGNYQEAEAALRPPAERIPASEAALELGLLLKMLGRSDADAVLGRVAAGSGREAKDFARVGRAL